jgi:hypothetical protein
LTELTAWCRGNLKLLQRTAHSACIHPERPHCILIYGGYGAVTPDNHDDHEPNWLCDFVILDTQSGAVSSLSPLGKPAAGTRGYHSITGFGHLCIVLFGRQDTHTIVPTESAVTVYDVRSNRWKAVKFKARSQGGDLHLPPIRSSHRACVTAKGVLIYGGAPSGTHQSGRRHSADKSNGRLSDLWLLRIDSATGNMEWENVCEGIGMMAEQPKQPEGRAGHVMEMVNDVLYLIGGYNKKSSYCSDVWCWNQTIDGEAAKPHKTQKELRSERNVPAAPLPCGVAKRARVCESGDATGNENGNGAADIGQKLLDTIANLRATVKHYQLREASLLRDQERAVVEIEQLRGELKTTDEAWRQTAREKDHWKMKSSEMQAYLATERSDRATERRELEERIESLLLETEELKNLLEMTKVNLTNAQAQFNIVQQAAENDRNISNDLYNNLKMQNDILQARIREEESRREQAEHERSTLQSILAAERVGWEEERTKSKWELSESRALQAKFKAQASEDVKEILCKLDQLHHRFQQIKDTTIRANAAQRRAEELAALARADNQRLLEIAERDQGDCDRDVEALRSTLSRMVKSLSAPNDWPP